MQLMLGCGPVTPDNGIYPDSIQAVANTAGTSEPGLHRGAEPGHWDLIRVVRMWEPLAMGLMCFSLLLAPSRKAIVDAQMRLRL